jgi:hypothetical protein
LLSISSRVESSRSMHDGAAPAGIANCKSRFNQKTTSVILSSPSRKRGKQNNLVSKNGEDWV